MCFAIPRRTDWCLRVASPIERRARRGIGAATVQCRPNLRECSDSRRSKACHISPSYPDICEGSPGSDPQLAMAIPLPARRSGQVPIDNKGNIRCRPARHSRRRNRRENARESRKLGTSKSHLRRGCRISEGRPECPVSPAHHQRPQTRSQKLLRRFGIFIRGRRPSSPSFALRPNRSTSSHH